MAPIIEKVLKFETWNLERTTYLMYRLSLALTLALMLLAPINEKVLNTDFGF